MFVRHERDLELLDLIAVKPVKLIAAEKGISDEAVYKWIKRIRGRMKEYQNYLNRIYAKQKQSKRVKKMTIDGSLDQEEDEDLLI